MELDSITITTLLAILAAISALYKYIVYNEGQDKLQLDLIINLVDQNLAEIVVIIENKGKVRAKILMKDFTWRAKLHKSIDSINSEGSTTSEQLTIINATTFLASNDLDDYTWVNGLTTQNYRDYFSVSTDVLYIEVTVKILYKDKEKDWHTIRKIIKVKKP